MLCCRKGYYKFIGILIIEEVRKVIIISSYLVIRDFKV